MVQHPLSSPHPPCVADRELILTAQATAPGHHCQVQWMGEAVTNCHLYFMLFSSKLENIWKHTHEHASLSFSKLYSMPHLVQGEFLIEVW